MSFTHAVLVLPWFAFSSEILRGGIVCNGELRYNWNRAIHKSSYAFDGREGFGGQINAGSTKRENAARTQRTLG